MSYFDLVYFLELFTIRSKKKYDKDLIIRCRRFIMSIYKEFLPYVRTNLNYYEFKSLIDYILGRSVSLSEDEFSFIFSFRKYVLDLTKI